MIKNCFKYLKATSTFMLAMYTVTIILLFGDRDNKLAVSPADSYCDDYFFEEILLLICIAFSLEVISYWIINHKSTVAARIVAVFLNLLQPIILIASQLYIYPVYVKFDAFSEYTYSFQLIGIGLMFMYGILSILAIIIAILNILSIRLSMQENQILKIDMEIVIEKKDTFIHLWAMVTPLICLGIYDNPDILYKEESVCMIGIGVLFILCSMLIFREWIIEGKYFHAIIGYLSYGLMASGLMHCLFDEIYYRNEVHWKTDIMAKANIYICIATIVVLIVKLVLKKRAGLIKGDIIFSEGKSFAIVASLIFLVLVLIYPYNVADDGEGNRVCKSLTYRIVFINGDYCYRGKREYNEKKGIRVELLGRDIYEDIAEK